MIKLKATLWCLPMAAMFVAAPSFVRLARAESPPVDVEIVTEGSEDEDFLSRDRGEEEEAEPAPDPAPEPDQPAPKKGKGRASAKVKSNGNAPVQTQVVNIVVGGPEQQAKSEAKPAAPATPPIPSKAEEMKALEADMEAARRRIAEVKAEKAAEAPPPAAPQFVSTPIEPVHHRGRGVEKGDLLASFSAGRAPTGVFVGGRLELMLSDWFGLEARGLIDPIRQGHDDDEVLVVTSRRGLRLEQNGRASWASPRADFDTANATGVTYMGELSAKLHLLPKRAFDPNLSFGAAHFGYALNADGESRKGGGVYMKAAAGLNWHWRWIFVGGEAAWYPLEAVRYTVEDSGGFRSRAEVVQEEGRPFDARRFVFSGHAGLRF